MDCLDHNAPTPIEQWLTSLQTKVGSEDEINPEKSVVRCRACSALITKNEFLIPILGETNHFFVNPAGAGFDIQTYQIAEGCVLAGAVTDYFSWFQGFAWQYSFCKQCNSHLGWYYSCEGIEGFFGLVTDRLILD
ncbi:hypothetical protein FT643_10720 [Ketobacter sp. MCCC 1A13808]|uniref:cereblon family protein n=1 Tax=Ketobacter sp. MCCC 1A13808 TaxID=2602738 RepID=UPI0012ECB627|nr:cereblon family protein [Ketobacter sp. MCCC 1A13808]MVF12613.1 hypothetical protein [Ketobacter sp. MCCC 1A13808]